MSNTCWSCFRQGQKLWMMSGEWKGQKVESEWTTAVRALANSVNNPFHIIEELREQSSWQGRYAQAWADFCMSNISVSETSISASSETQIAKFSCSMGNKWSVFTLKGEGGSIGKLMLTHPLKPVSLTAMLVCRYCIIITEFLLLEGTNFGNFCFFIQHWFTELPPVLTFELSRFEFNQALGRPEKIHNKLEFPPILYLDRYGIILSTKF